MALDEEGSLSCSVPIASIAGCPSNFPFLGWTQIKDYVANSPFGFDSSHKACSRILCTCKANLSFFYLNVLNNNSGLKKSTTCAVSQSVSQSVSWFSHPYSCK